MGCFESLELVPFEKVGSGPQPKSVKIEYKLGHSIELLFRLSGFDLRYDHTDFNRIAAKKHELWKHTCFEMFILPDSIQEEYYEFNYSPKNLYDMMFFSEYRQPGSHGHIDPPKLSLNSDQGSSLVFLIKQKLPFIPAINQMIKINMAFIWCEEDKVEYWSLAHSKSGPDFHNSALYRDIVLTTL
jgi:hypothetical protein